MNETIEDIIQNLPQDGYIKNYDEDEEVKKSTGKSISHFRKCGDADDKDHNIHFADAIKLDVLLQKKKLGTPFLDHLNFKLECELRKINEYENISSVLINIGGRIGNLMDITQEAIDPVGQAGSNISNEEINNTIQKNQNNTLN